MELFTCPDCKLQFTERYFEEYHTPCPDNPDNLDSDMHDGDGDHIVVEVRSLRELDHISGFERKWYHNTTSEKIEEWMLWVGLAAVAAAIAFVITGR